MKVFLVEDDDSHAARIRGITEAHGVEFFRASSREAAERELDSGRHYDLVVCDLKIFSHDNGMDRQAEHGLAVFHKAGAILPGTPRYFLTGVAQDHIDEVADAASKGGVSHALGEGEPIEMVTLFRKDRTLLCGQRMIDLATRLLTLDSIPIELRGSFSVELGLSDHRATRLAVRHFRGDRAVVEELGGGFSSSRTLHVMVFDGSAPRASIFLKIDRLAKCANELDRYVQFVQGSLPHTAFPSFVVLLSDFMGTDGCLMYKFADSWNGSFFKALRSDGFDASAALRQARTLMEPWSSMQESRPTSLKDLRERVASSERFLGAVSEGLGCSDDALFVALDDFESAQLDLTYRPQHGDLHGENVLHSEDHGITLIDAGDVGMHLAGIDPLAMEFSLFCHPKSPIYGGGWPSVEEASRWGDLDSYLATCPFPSLVRSLREWFTDICPLEQRPIAAYLQAAGQLRHSDTPKPVLVAVLRSLVGSSARRSGALANHGSDTPNTAALKAAAASACMPGRTC